MAEKKKKEAASSDLFVAQTDTRGTNEQDFESSLARLEEIVKEMEGGGMTLSESMKLFEEGSRHIRSLHVMLGVVREKVLMLVNGENGSPELKEYTGEK
jgi:exodeoxyribonuclease VII small subunit